MFRIRAIIATSVEGQLTTVVGARETVSRVLKTRCKNQQERQLPPLNLNGPNVTIVQVIGRNLGSGNKKLLNSG